MCRKLIHDIKAEQEIIILHNIKDAQVLLHDVKETKVLLHDIAMPP